MENFGLNMLVGRWFMFFASILILSVAGGTYIYSLYSEEVKISLGYDQTTLNLLGFFKDLGANVGIISGLINEITPPWVVILLGAFMNFSGYFSIWLAVTEKLSKPKVWQMCFCIFIGANSQTFVNTGVLVTCVKNFPESRGIVIGLLKGFVGLSGAILTQLYHAFYGNKNGKSLILLIAWLPTVVSFVFLRVIREMKVTKQENELKIFYQLFFMSLGLAGFLMAIIIVENRVEFSSFGYWLTAGTILVLLFAPVIVVVREELNLWDIKKQNLSHSVEIKVNEIERPLQCSATVVPINDQKEPVSFFQDVFKPPERGEDYTILQAVLSIDMLILFIATIFGAGGLLTAMDNLGQIGKALGYPKTSITTFVSLVSIWGYLGRVGSGFASEIFLEKYKFPRPLMLTIVLFFSCVVHVLIALGVPNTLYAASVLIGLCFGALWPLIFAIISEIFGLKHYSTLLNFGGAASPIGAYIFNVKVAGNLYDREAMKQMAAHGIIRKRGEDLTCTGVECYKLAFLIIAASTFVGFIVSLVLVLRTFKFYKGDIYKKFREQAKAVDAGESQSRTDGDSPL